MLDAVLLGRTGSGTALAGVEVISEARMHAIVGKLGTASLNDEIVVAMGQMCSYAPAPDLTNIAQNVIHGAVRAETLAGYLRAVERLQASPGDTTGTARTLVELAEQSHHDLALAIYNRVEKADRYRAEEGKIKALMLAEITDAAKTSQVSASVMRLGRMIFQDTPVLPDGGGADWVTDIYTKLRADDTTASAILAAIKNKTDADLVIMFRHIWPHFPPFRAACAADTEFMLRMLLSNAPRLDDFAKYAYDDRCDIAQHAAGLVHALGADRLSGVADGICSLEGNKHAYWLRLAIRAEISGRTAWPSDAVLRVIHHFEWQVDRTSTAGFLDMTVTAANSADLAFFLKGRNTRLGEDDKVIEAAIDASKNGFTDVGAALLRGATEATLRKKLAKLAPVETVHLVVCTELLPYLGPVEALARKWYRNEAGQRTFQAFKLLKQCAFSEKEVGLYIAMAMKRGGAMAQQATQLASVLRSSSFGLLGSFLYTE